MKSRNEIYNEINCAYEQILKGNIEKLKFLTF